MALPQPVTEPELVAVAQPALRLRRCNYRRLSRIEVGSQAGYEVSCLYPDRRLPLPLGTMDQSSVVCAACTADHIFRPDED
jgi:hypothetical protein